MTGCGICLFDSNILLNESIIDQTVETRRLLVRSLAMQWFGQYLFPSNWADYWLIIGLANYVAGLFVRKLYGNNEYRFRMKKDMERVHELDVNRPPLYCANVTDAPLYEDAWNDEFLNLKAPIVIYMLERFLGKNFMQKVINKTLVSAISGELTSGISTHYFLKQLKKTSGKELKPFPDQWIYGNGTPRLTCSYTFNRKKNLIELVFEQDRSRVKYHGNLIVRVNEPDGTFDHIVQIDDWSHRFDLLYHTKYKRLRNNKKAQMRDAKLQRELEEREKAEGLRPPPGTEADEEMCQNDPELQAELQKADWIRDSHGDQETIVMNYAILWIRLDPDLELLCEVSFTQADYMWNQQLTKDKDVVAQYDAVKAMTHITTMKMCSCLFRVMMDVRSYFRIRMEAAYAMAKGFALQRLDDVGVKLLFLAYRKKYCVSVGLLTPNSLPTFVPRRNDFKALTEYYMQKAIINALSMVRSERPILGTTIRSFLLDQIKLNDNSQNIYSDSNYVAAIIDAIGTSFVDYGKSEQDLSSLPPALHGPSLMVALGEVERRLFLETQIPSYRNVVATTCLSVLLRWMVNGIIPVDVKPFLVFSRPGNFVDVRLCAISGLVVVGLSRIQDQDSSITSDGQNTTVAEIVQADPGAEAVVKYLLHIISNDTAYIRYATVKSVCAFIGSIAVVARRAKEEEVERKKQEDEEKQRIAEAAAREHDPEIEDLAAGITKRVTALQRNRGNEATKLIKQLKDMTFFRDKLWNLLT